MTTRIVVERGNVRPDAVEQAAACLRKGQIVALPTETVYGLAVRADDPQAIERLFALKGRPTNKPFAHLLHSVEQLPRPLPRLARLAVHHFWPGPLTVLLDDAQGSTHGYRLPASEATRRIAAAVGAPLLLTSANKSGEPDAVEAPQIESLSGSGLAAVVDSGPALLGEPSTVVHFGEHSWHVRREGVLSVREMEKRLRTHVLFVCTGNSCRSPMAEALLLQMAAEKLGLREGELKKRGFKVGSCGIAAMAGSPAARHAVTLLRERGSRHLEKHRARQADVQLLEGASAIITLGHSHYRWLVEAFPELEARIALLDPDGVADPIGGSLDVYRTCAAQIEAALEPLLEKVLRDGMWEGAP